VDDDPVQPGAERAAAIEAVEPAHRREEGLLCDVLCSSRVVDDEVRGAVRLWPVVPKQRLEIGDGSLLRAADPGALVASAGRHALTLRAGYGLESMPRGLRDGHARRSRRAQHGELIRDLQLARAEPEERSGTTSARPGRASSSGLLEHVSPQ